MTPHHNGDITSVPAQPVERSVLLTMCLALVPGLMMLVSPYVLEVLDPVGRTAVLSSYYLAEAVMLFGIMFLFAKRRQQSFSEVIGLTQPMPIAVFIVLAAFGAAWAIAFRDFYHPEWVGSWAQSVQGTMPSGWPSIFARLPAHDNFFEGFEFFGLLVGTVSVVTASLAQSLYFRGFLLSGIMRLGWIAPTLITFIFVVFHMGSPPFWHVFLMLTLPWAFIAYWKKNVWVVAASHMVMNGYGGVLVMISLLADT